MLDKNVLKQWFKTRAKPTQGQFWQWIDACFFKGEKLPQSDVEGLTEVLNAIQLWQNSLNVDQLTGITADTQTYTGDATYNVPAGYMLEKFIVLPQGGNIMLTVGASSGGSEIAEAESITTDGQVYVVNLYAVNAINLYLTGITTSTKVVFLKRKIETI